VRHCKREMPGTCVIAPPAALPSKAAWAVGNPAPLSGTVSVVWGLKSYRGSHTPTSRGADSDSGLAWLARPMEDVVFSTGKTCRECSGRDGAKPF